MASKDLYIEAANDLSSLERDCSHISSELRRAIKDHVKHDPASQEIVASIGEVIGLTRSAQQCLDEAGRQLKSLLEYDLLHDEKLFKSS